MPLTQWLRILWRTEQDLRATECLLCTVRTRGGQPTSRGLHVIPPAHLCLAGSCSEDALLPEAAPSHKYVTVPLPQCLPLYTQSHGSSKFFLFETQKCKIAEISNISRSATILPLCTKDLMINAHTYKNTVCIAYVQYMCKHMAFRHSTEPGQGCKRHIQRHHGFSFKNNIKATHEWTPDCHHFLFMKLVLP